MKMPKLFLSTVATEAVIALAKDCKVYVPSNTDNVLEMHADNGALLGFLAWRQVNNEAELLSIAVASTARRQGIANTLLEHLFQRVEHCSLFLEVRQSNQAAIACYEKNLFTVIGIRKNYYPTADGFETAIVMKRNC